jgi:thymidine kinase
MELADNIEEIKTICQFCNNKAIINMKYIEKDGEKKAVKYGSSDPDIGCEEKYIPVCWSCWNHNI